MVYQYSREEFEEVSKAAKALQKELNAALKEDPPIIECIPTHAFEEAWGNISGYCKILSSFLDKTIPKKES